MRSASVSATDDAVGGLAIRSAAAGRGGRIGKLRCTARDLMWSALMKDMSQYRKIGVKPLQLTI